MRYLISTMILFISSAIACEKCEEIREFIYSENECIWDMIYSGGMEDYDTFLNVARGRLQAYDNILKIIENEPRLP